jgi:Proteins of 100 residues with WXG
MGFLGADPAALEEAAQGFSKSAETILNGQQSLTRQLASGYWQGPEAEAFRSRWHSHFCPSLARSSRSLQNMAKDLQRQAREQRQASEGFAISSPGSPGIVDSQGTDFWKKFGDGQNGLFTAASAADVLPTVLKREMELVSGYTKSNGTVVESYWRWKSGTAATLKPLFGSADDLERVLTPASKFGKVANVAGVALSGIVQLGKDWGKYEADEETGRVAAAVLTSYAVNVASTQAAILAASTFGGPAGIVVGLFVVGAWYVLSEKTQIDEWIIDKGGWLVAEGPEWLMDTGADLLEGAGGLAIDVLDEFGDLAGDGLDAVGDGLDALGDLAGEGLDAVGDFVDDWNPFD